MIQSYLDQLKRIVDSYAAASFVLHTEVSVEIRPGDQGFVVGSILFLDQSILHFREYLDGSANQVDKLMYSYHYQDTDKQLIFRYDNARHRPPLLEIEHKHTANDVFPSQGPTLEAVLAEIVDMKDWV